MPGDAKEIEVEMSDQAETLSAACCAHMSVDHRDDETNGRVTKEWWECRDCEMRFCPITRPTPVLMEEVQTLRSQVAEWKDRFYASENSAAERVEKLTEAQGRRIAKLEAEAKCEVNGEDNRLTILRSALGQTDMHSSAEGIQLLIRKRDALRTGLEECVIEMARPYIPTASHDQALAAARALLQPENPTTTNMGLLGFAPTEEAIQKHLATHQPYTPGPITARLVERPIQVGDWVQHKVHQWTCIVIAFLPGKRVVLGSSGYPDMVWPLSQLKRIPIGRRRRRST